MDELDKADKWTKSDKANLRVILICLATIVGIGYVIAMIISGDLVRSAFCFPLVAILMLERTPSDAKISLKIFKQYSFFGGAFVGCILTVLAATSRLFLEMSLCLVYIMIVMWTTNFGRWKV